MTLIHYQHFQPLAVTYRHLPSYSCHYGSNKYQIEEHSICLKAKILYSVKNWSRLKSLNKRERERDSVKHNIVDDDWNQTCWRYGNHKDWTRRQGCQISCMNNLKIFQDKWTEARKGIFPGSHHNLIIFYLIRIIFFLALFQPFHLC